MKNWLFNWLFKRKYENIKEILIAQDAEIVNLKSKIENLEWELNVIKNYD